MWKTARGAALASKKPWNVVLGADVVQVDADGDNDHYWETQQQQPLGERTCSGIARSP